MSNNKKRMAKLFADCAGGEPVRLRAQLLAALHERGADYVEQAPVIAVVSLRYNRDDLTAVWRRLCESGEKLGVVMDKLKINRGFRNLSPHALTVSAAETLGARMQGANISAIAQQIAARTAEEQRAWYVYWEALLGRGIQMPLVMWFAENMPITLPESARDVGHMADFLRTPHVRAFDPSWRWRDMMAGVKTWEEEFRAAKALQEAKYNAPLSPHKDAPAKWERDGWTFTLLNTVNELRLEGADMAHCVGGYGGYVESGQSLIYSVKNGATRAGTLQISSEPVIVMRLKKVEKPGDPITEQVTAYRWRMTQYKAKRNSDPSEDAKRMAAAFLAAAFPDPQSDRADHATQRQTVPRDTVARSFLSDWNRALAQWTQGRPV